MKIAFFVTFILALTYAFGQPSSPHNGVKPSQFQKYHLKNASIFVTPTLKIENASLIIENERIIYVGQNPDAQASAMAQEIDCKGLTILPGFIEVNASFGLPEAKSAYRGSSPQINSTRDLQYHWNDAIHPEYNPATNYAANEKDITRLNKMGFTTAAVHLHDGLVQGYGSVVDLFTGSKTPIIANQKAAYYSFRKGASRQSYPSSQMGSIALLRQTFFDLTWYQQTGRAKGINFSYEALEKQKAMPLFFDVDDKYEILRAEKIAREFNLQFHYLTSGNEYEILRDLKGIKSTLIVPIALPKKFDVADPYTYQEVELGKLKHWELAPGNAAFLAKQGNTIALSSKGITNEQEFWKNVQALIQNGLPVEKALAALTVEPAKLLGMSQDLGTLEKGKYASFTIYSGDPFSDKCDLLELWSLGQRQAYKKAPDSSIAGVYELKSDSENFRFKMELKKEFQGEIIRFSGASTDSLPLKMKVKVQDGEISFSYTSKARQRSTAFKGHIYGNNIRGSYRNERGQLTPFEAVKVDTVSAAKKKEDKPIVALTDSLIWFPNMAYGAPKTPTNNNVLIENARVWTNGQQGILEKAHVLVQNGKITYVGTSVPKLPEGTQRIDGSGFQLTSGIIDEHSHIAISRGVNEGGQSISSEVSIADVVRGNDINIYRQLAGGVTCSQLLHGSANAIGGQSAIIKLKWGLTPAEMLVPSAPKFIKFALGENVKQANWGESVTNRFPQTRMGVEQVFYDGFLRAKIYQQDKALFAKDKSKNKGLWVPDLELETLSEILRGERHITCHSYVQSEINMLLKVADSMGFKVNTFTHILEGYKVADKMKAHGAGASTFADWWAYKNEVKDAIPFNAGILHKQGIVTAINSDDAEMGRRLNQEAGKIVKYSGISQEDAWKMVTLNPAKLLHLDQRIGSVEVGKDADLVLWSDNPLSIYARVLYTWIEGVAYYSEEDDLRKRELNQVEKDRLVQKMLKSDEEPDRKQAIKDDKKQFHCNTIGEEMSHEHNEH